VGEEKRANEFFVATDMFDGALLTDSQKRRGVLSRWSVDGVVEIWKDESGVLASHVFGTIQLLLYINNCLFFLLLNANHR
jgi:hypothetical protein